MKVRIIADDFTSAADGLVGFATRFGGAGVAIPGGRSGPNTRAPFARSVDTDSRVCSNKPAAERLAIWAVAWRDADILLKQFDSTLRGPLASECLAAWRSSGRRPTLVAPAFPAAGRTTQHGRVLIDETRVSRTAFAHDPLTLASEDFLPALFAAHRIELAVASDATDVDRLFDLGQRAVVLDATDEAVLRAAASRFRGDRGILWAGSTGSARALADSLSATFAVPVDVQRALRPWVLLGSRHPASRREGARLAEAGCQARLLTTPGDPIDPKAAALQVAREAGDAVRRGACDGVVANGAKPPRRSPSYLTRTCWTCSARLSPGLRCAG